MVNNKRVLIIVDYSWCMHTYFHAYKNFSFTYMNEARKTGIAYGFARLVESLWKRYPNSKIVFAKDSKSKERKDLDSTYKANREHNKDVFSMDLVSSSLICGLDNTSFIHAEGKEADDLIALYAFKHKDAFEETFVYSRDNDMFQLVPFGINVSYELGKDCLVPVSQEYLDKKYNKISFEHLLHYRALLGDSSDNISAIITNKNFAKFFAELWFTTPLDELLDPENFQKYFGTCKISRCNVSEVVESIRVNLLRLINNYKLMDLKKYQIEDYHFNFREFRVEFVPSLIKIYGLSTFDFFLENYSKLKGNYATKA